MKFDPKNPIDLEKSKVRYDYLVKKGDPFELKGIRKKRTIKQNSYLHVVITLYAINFGSTLNEAKTDLKRECHFMMYQKDGKKYLRETKRMNTKELTEFIDWIRNYSSMNGCYIPTSEEYLQNICSIDNEIERLKEYL